MILGTLNLIPDPAAGRIAGPRRVHAARDVQALGRPGPVRDVRVHPAVPAYLAGARASTTPLSAPCSTSSRSSCCRGGEERHAGIQVARARRRELARPGRRAACAPPSRRGRAASRRRRSTASTSACRWTTSPRTCWRTGGGCAPRSVCRRSGWSCPARCTARPCGGSERPRRAAARSTARRVIGEHDGLLTAAAGLGLVISYADCVPIVIVAEGEEGPLYATVHAGWRGMIAGIGGLAAAELGRRGRLVAAAMGPSIGPCCFAVDDGLRRRFEARYPGSAGADDRRPLALRQARSRVRRCARGLDRRGRPLHRLRRAVLLAPAGPWGHGKALAVSVAAGSRGGRSTEEGTVRGREEEHSGQAVHSRCGQGARAVRRRGDPRRGRGARRRARPG